MLDSVYARDQAIMVDGGGGGSEKLLFICYISTYFTEGCTDFLQEVIWQGNLWFSRGVRPPPLLSGSADGVRAVVLSIYSLELTQWHRVWCFKILQITTTF